MLIMDSKELLALCRAGDRVAVDQLVQEYQPQLFRLALSILDDGSIRITALPKRVENMEGYVSEVCVSLLSDVSTFREMSQRALVRLLVPPAPL